MTFGTLYTYPVCIYILLILYNILCIYETSANRTFFHRVTPAQLPFVQLLRPTTLSSTSLRPSQLRVSPMTTLRSTSSAKSQPLSVLTDIPSTRLLPSPSTVCLHPTSPHFVWHKFAATLHTYILLCNDEKKSYSYPCLNHSMLIFIN